MLSVLLALIPQPEDPAAIMDFAREQFAAPRHGYYLDAIGRGADRKQVMFNWSVGIYLSAENALCRLNKRRIPKLEQALEMADTYWNSVGPVPGFDVVPGPNQPNDRYYDDNAWMAMSLVESYEITHETRWLKRAQEALDYALSGEDGKFGGGIYWREKPMASKNTCSNAPTAAACLAVYKYTKETALLFKSQDLYQWTKTTLRDPAEGLYWDNISPNGSIEKTKWSYNSALMLRTAKELAKLTKNVEYANDAKELESNSIKRWIRPDGTISDDLQFAHLLFENLNPKNFDAKRCIDKLLQCRDDNGYFGNKWTPPGVGKREFMHQASAVRAIAMYRLQTRRPKHVN